MIHLWRGLPDDGFLLFPSQAQTHGAEWHAALRRVKEDRLAAICPKLALCRSLPAPGGVIRLEGKWDSPVAAGGGVSHPFCAEVLGFVIGSPILYGTSELRPHRWLVGFKTLDTAMPLSPCRGLADVDSVVPATTKEAVAYSGVLKAVQARLSALRDGRQAEARERLERQRKAREAAQAEHLAAVEAVSRTTPDAIARQLAG